MDLKKRKKYNFISLILNFIALILTLFPNAQAINYSFEIKNSSQVLHNKDKFSLDLNLVSEYSKYQRLHPFICNIKFDKNLFTFQKILPTKNIRSADIATENTGNEIIIKFNPREARIVPLISNMAEIFKINFICKCSNCYQDASFETKIIDTVTRENIFSDTKNITIENENHSQGHNSSNVKNRNKNNKILENKTNTNIDCRIKSIIPSEGDLCPSFDSDIFTYEINVPKETQEIYFDVTPINEGTKIKINKHKLGAPGTTTYINITSKNHLKSLSYLIKVKRSLDSFDSNLKNNSQNNSSQHKKSKGKTKKSKKKSNHKSSSKEGSDENYDDTENCDDEEEILDDDEVLKNENEYNTDQSEKINLNNNKTYSLAIAAIILLLILMFLFFKFKPYLKFIKKSKIENTNSDNYSNQNQK